MRYISLAEVKRILRLALITNGVDPDARNGSKKRRKAKR